MRIHSIDAIRAVTMLLMIWVNDFWSLEGVPDWLQHMPAEADALGFSDVIFPAFLVIVGLSIPFAIEARRGRGDSVGRIQWHIVERSFALLVMGVFMVNLEYAGSADLAVAKPVWQVLMVVAFGLIWNAYPKRDDKRRLFVGLKGLGWLMLAGLAWGYGDGPGSGNWLEPRWWGILGLIGWAYLLGATLYLHFGDRVSAMAVGMGAFFLVNVGSFAGWFDWLAAVREFVWVVGDGSMPSLTMAGVVASTVYLRWGEAVRGMAFARFLMLFGVVALGVGFALRPAWGISKIQSTPAWTAVCAGITLLSYAALYWLVDLRKFTGWTKALGAAGTATLTCYLTPYLVYPLWQAIGVTTPEAIRTGALGLANAMVFAFVVVWITEGLTRIGIKLKV